MKAQQRETCLIFSENIGKKRIFQNSPTQELLLLVEVNFAIHMRLKNELEFRKRLLKCGFVDSSQSFWTFAQEKGFLSGPRQFRGVEIKNSYSELDPETKPAVSQRMQYDYIQ